MKVKYNLIIGLLIISAFITGCTATPTPSASPTPSPVIPTSTTTPPPPKEGAVNVWLTTADQTALLAAQPDALFAPAETDNGSVIDVNENNHYQQMDGFGAALTDSSAWLMSQLNGTQRTRLMSALFSSTEGIGISAIRLPMGASDFVHGDPYTYDDLPAGKTDPALAQFSIAHDQAYIIPTLQDALNINPTLKIIASPWSAPAWMKSSDSLLNGSLKKEYYQTYASYFVKFIQAYQAENIPIYAITLQNEPHFEPNTYPGMRFEASDEADFVKNALGPAFAAAGIQTKILVWDHNWKEWAYPIEVLDDADARPYIGGSAFHCYQGIVLGQQLVHNAYPQMDLYFTECSSGAWIGSFGETLKLDMKNLVIGASRGWAKTVILWNLALDPSFGPHNGGCANCYGFVTIDPKSKAGFTFNYDYYAIGHASKFVTTGAYRIASSSFEYEGLESVAFKNPDDSKVLIVANTSSSPKTFTIRSGGAAFSYTLASNSATTFTWTMAQKNTATPTPPKNLKAKANPVRVFVTWDFSSQADSYTVKRADKPDGPFTAIATGLTLPEFVDAQASSTGSYYYLVSAVNSFGESQDSEKILAAP